MRGAVRRLAIAALALLWLAACGGRDDELPGKATSDVGEALTTEVTQWYGDSPLGGVVAVVRLPSGAEHVIVLGHGDGQQPLAADDVFRLGSITKTFTAVLLLGLAEDGQLDLERPAADYLPEFGLEREVTIRHLLQHTSGLADYNNVLLLEDILADLTRRWRPEELVSRVSLGTTAFRPGTQWAYSNTGYILLGLVLERSTGTDLDRLVSDRILARIRLTSTAFPDPSGATEGVVTGYVDLDGDGAVDSLSGVPYDAVSTSAWSAGAMTGTASDLVRFMDALFSGGLISEESLATMIAKPWPLYGYALGIEAITFSDGVAWGHSGGTPGYAAVMAHDPDSGVTVAALTNCASCPSPDGGPADIGTLIRGLLEVAVSHE
jgi:D-alanyl-D-alanine carboxypeptidase